MRVVTVHRKIHAIRHDTLYGGQEIVNCRTDLQHILCRERRKHMVDDRPSCGRTSDADAHACKVLAAHMSEDRLDAVVPARASLSADAHRPCGDIHIIVNNGQILCAQFIV